MADFTAWTDRIWGFTLSVIFNICGKSIFYRSETLAEEGLLTETECTQADFGEKEEEIDYEKLYKQRFHVLKKAFVRFEKSKEKQEKDYENFVRTNRDWLEDYCLYMAIKDSLGGISWIEWSKELRDREEQALKCARLELAEESVSTVFNNMNLTSSGKICTDMPMNMESGSSEIFRSMLRLTARIHGRIRNCSNLMKIICRQAWQDARRMDFPQQGSCGEIRFIVGNTIRKQDTTGG